RINFSTSSAFCSNISKPPVCGKVSQTRTAVGASVRIDDGKRETTRSNRRGRRTGAARETLRKDFTRTAQPEPARGNRSLHVLASLCESMTGYGRRLAVMGYANASWSGWNQGRWQIDADAGRVRRYSFAGGLASWPRTG